jgi:hypothetical protein
VQPGGGNIMLACVSAVTAAAAVPAASSAPAAKIGSKVRRAIRVFKIPLFVAETAAGGERYRGCRVRGQEMTSLTTRSAYVPRGSAA